MFDSLASGSTVHRPATKCDVHARKYVRESSLIAVSNALMVPHITAPAEWRTQAFLVYRDKEFGISAQVLFEFTDGKLNDISYVADSPPQNPELAFLTWCLELPSVMAKAWSISTKSPSAGGAWCWTKV